MLCLLNYARGTKVSARCESSVLSDEDCALEGRRHRPLRQVRARGLSAPREPRGPRRRIQRLVRREPLHRRGPLREPAGRRRPVAQLPRAPNEPLPAAVASRRNRASSQCRLRAVRRRGDLGEPVRRQVDEAMHLLFLDESGQLSERKFFALGGVALARRRLARAPRPLAGDAQLGARLAGRTRGQVARDPHGRGASGARRRRRRRARPCAAPLLRDAARHRARARDGARVLRAATRTRTPPDSCSSPSASSSCSRPPTTSG